MQYGDLIHLSLIDIPGLTTLNPRSGRLATRE
jgi:hypothetical protein